jgi:hypothetical protein
MSSDTKTKDIAPFGLRMPWELRQRLQAEADQMERSLNWTINHLLSQILEMRKASEPQPRIPKRLDAEELEQLRQIAREIRWAGPAKE